MHTRDFGKRRKRSLGESYRKAKRLEDSFFSTNFRTQDYEIVDAIVLTLLLSVNGEVVFEAGWNGNGSEGREYWGVTAELDKLNVNSSL